jgi:hypothetical protein
MSIKNKLILRLGITIQPNKWNGGILWVNHIHKYQNTILQVIMYSVMLLSSAKHPRISTWRIGGHLSIGVLFLLL